MIINNTPNNEAVLSNVGEIGEFRIRNSAKAFNILSSGLYANKIRAVIRELSCNAVDSHVAAGRDDVPFDVHLPTTLEPWFAVRDYGTGLSHDQVTQIYTTYFESTKTASNEFIGALGLGSKSPFSYTDNFTVTAVQNGKKGIYSAFINAEGVPSIAQMMTEETTDPNGVEVKFSVNERWDFDKFYDEARRVYTYFKLRPVISGPSDFEFRDIKYETIDLIPGVNVMVDNYRNSRAIMGNIDYPIDVPNAEKNLGVLGGLLYCGLEIHFNIGELDFQASREGLSYIPQTIDAIKRKLETINAELSVYVAKEADAIDNLWDRAEFLLKKSRTSLWEAAVIKYVHDTKFKLVDATNKSYLRPLDYKFNVQMLAKKFNINLSGFVNESGSVICSTLKPKHEWSDINPKKPLAPRKQVHTWNITVQNNVFFIVNDTKIGASERAKNHFRKDETVRAIRGSKHVFVLTADDAKKPMLAEQFFKAISNPRTDRVMLASSLIEKERKVTGTSQPKDVTILKLTERGYGSYYRSQDMVWKDAGKAADFDTKEIHYYLPLSGFNLDIEEGGIQISSIKRFYDQLTESGIPEFRNITLLGVRKGDIEFIKTQKNWVNVQTKLKEVFSKLTVADMSKVALRTVDVKSLFKYNSQIIKHVTSVTSPYALFTKQFKDIDNNGKFDVASFDALCKNYGGTVDLTTLNQNIDSEYAALRSRYPLLGGLRDYDMNYQAIAEYINLIDLKEEV